MTEKTSSLHRRDFLKVSLGTLGVLMLPRINPFSLAALAATHAVEPHFFLQIFVLGGMDPSYLFDARPLDLTAKGKIQNYLAADPDVWTGANGQTSLATRLVAPLRPHADSFSVLNGVHMATGFDGHDQNFNLFMAGDPFGGESFIPHLNQDLAPLPIDAVQSGFLGDFSNTGNIIPLDSDSAKILVGQVRNAPAFDANNKLFSFIESRYQANNTSAGRFSKGAEIFARAYAQVPQLAANLGGMNVGESDNPEAAFVALLGELFKNNGARSGILSLSPPAVVDTHDPLSAQKQPELFTYLAQKIADIFAALKATPFDAQRSLLDVTTVLVGSEFGRTMRQIGLGMEATGTDHNPLSNSILIGGKGVKHGWVVGESDFRTADETLSGAHTWLDAQGLKVMGRPFDHASLQVRRDLPATYDPADYLQMASVANTLYSLFGVGAARYRKIARNGAVAPVLNGLLA